MSLVETYKVVSKIVNRVEEFVPLNKVSCDYDIVFQKKFNQLVYIVELDIMTNDDRETICIVFKKDDGHSKASLIEALEEVNRLSKG